MVWATERKSFTEYSTLGSKLTFVSFSAQACMCDLKANKTNIFSHSFKIRNLIKSQIQSYSHQKTKVSRTECCHHQIMPMVFDM